MLCILVVYSQQDTTIPKITAKTLFWQNILKPRTQDHRGYNLYDIRSSQNTDFSSVPNWISRQFEHFEKICKKLF